MRTLFIEKFLTAHEVGNFRAFLRDVPFENGKVSAGNWIQDTKSNKQAMPESVRQLADTLAQRLFGFEALVQYAQPYRAGAPTFCRYDTGDFYERHEDNPLQQKLRADISYTLFLSEPTEYEGGALFIDEEANESVAYRPPAGSLLLYPCGTPHSVERVTGGTRFVAVGWIQSVFRSQEQREMISEFQAALDILLHGVGPRDQSFLRLNRIRNYLVRMWSEAR